MRLRAFKGCRILIPTVHQKLQTRFRNTEITSVYETKEKKNDSAAHFWVDLHAIGYRKALGLDRGSLRFLYLWVSQTPRT